MDQYIGKLLDNRYEILECIGAGGMAVVYKARCHRLNRLVAVKILKPELAQDAEFRRRFHDESQAVAMLSHPNIVAVYDVSHSDELDYIVMELIDGITLKQYMQKKGLPLNWREALHFITQIMKGLSHAHERGIIHRDIKPQNIMVLRDGSVKVADFGIARVASSAQATLTQEALGSVHYISPEQARGSRIDSRSDIYSAGVVLYEMTAGRLPYEGETAVSVAIQHINSIPLPPRDVNPDIPEALEAITLKAMAPDVNRRYLSADAMLADLEEFRKNPSINFDYTQEDLTPARAADEPTIVRPAEDGSGALRRGRERREERPEEEDERPGRGGPWPVILAAAAILIFIAGIGYFLFTTISGGILGDHSAELVVPNLIGKTLDEVNQDLIAGTIDRAFVIEEGKTVISDLPAGQIAFQDPDANERKKGDRIVITVDVSAGPEELVMPEVYNREYRLVTAELAAMGMAVSQERENSEVTRDYVIRSEPLPGEALTPGQQVTLVISLGPEVKKTIVPEFRLMSVETARNNAEISKLTVTVEEAEDASHEKGTVIYQSIAPYTEVPEGTAITLRVSSGPPEGEPSPSPDASQEPEPSPDASQEPSPSPDASQEPSPSPDAAPSPQPSQDAPASSGTAMVSVDLSPYLEREQVAIRIEVGGGVQYNSPVDPRTGTFLRTVTGTGVQRVVVYVDDVPVQDYQADFGA